MLLRRDVGKGTRGKEDPTMRKSTAEGKEALRTPPSLCVYRPPRSMAEPFHKMKLHREAAQNTGDTWKPEDLT